MLDPFLSHELAVGRDHRGQRVVRVRVERDIFHRRRLLSRLNTAECLPRTRYPRRARRRSAYIPSTEGTAAASTWAAALSHLPLMITRCTSRTRGAFRLGDARSRAP